MTQERVILISVLVYLGMRAGTWGLFYGVRELLRAVMSWRARRIIRRFKEAQYPGRDE